MPPGGGSARGSGFGRSGVASRLPLAVVFALPLLLLPGASAASASAPQVAEPAAGSGGGRPRLRLGASPRPPKEHGGVAADELIQLMSQARRLDKSTDNSTGNLTGEALKQEVLLRLSRQQVALLDRLSQLDGELSRLLDTAKVDLALASESDAALTNITERTDAANLESQETAVSINATNSTQQTVSKNVESTDLAEAAMRAQIADAQNKEAQAASAASVGQQVDDNRRIVERIGPRLMKLNKRLVAIEARLQHNNISEVVEDATKRAMSDVLRDMNRGLYRQLPD